MTDQAKSVEWLKYGNLTGFREADNGQPNTVKRKALKINLNDYASNAIALTIYALDDGHHDGYELSWIYEQIKICIKGKIPHRFFPFGHWNVRLIKIET